MSLDQIGFFTVQGLLDEAYSVVCHLPLGKNRAFQSTNNGFDKVVKLGQRIRYAKHRNKATIKSR